MHEGGCKDFFLRRFVLSGPEVLKIEFSYRQWIDIHTKKKQSQKKLTDPPFMLFLKEPSSYNVSTSFHSSGLVLKQIPILP